MPKQIGVSWSFDSIVYTRTCDVIVTPMCNCVCAYWPRRTVWRPIYGRSARQGPLRIIYMNLDLYFGANGDYHGAQWRWRLTYRVAAINILGRFYNSTKSNRIVIDVAHWSGL